ncbi:MAG: hypothetical protein ACHQ2Y_06205 [Candidatus Lutacidiplasmatales archaeon]
MPRPKKQRSERRVPLAVYVPAEILEKLRRLAEKDRRTVSTEALLLLEQAMEAKKS